MILAEAMPLVGWLRHNDATFERKHRGGLQVGARIMGILAETGVATCKDSIVLRSKRLETVAGGDGILWH